MSPINNPMPQAYVLPGDISTETHKPANSEHGIERSLQLHWRDALRQQEGPELVTRPRSPNALPSQGRYSNQPTPRSRMSSLPSLYNVANLVNIKHQRRVWIENLIKYGIYTLFVAFIYLVLIGAPLWKGGVFWLFWLMKNKFVFQGGWAIVIAVLILWDPNAVWPKRCANAITAMPIYRYLSLSRLILPDRSITRNGTSNRELSTLLY
jgi:hypothetical protein